MIIIVINGQKICLSTKVQDIIAKRDLEASVLENMPLVQCIMTTEEWIFMICHPETMFACAGMRERMCLLGETSQLPLQGV